MVPDSSAEICGTATIVEDSSFLSKLFSWELHESHSSCWVSVLGLAMARAQVRAPAAVSTARTCVPRSCGHSRCRPTVFRRDTYHRKRGDQCSWRPCKKRFSNSRRIVGVAIGISEVEDVYELEGRAKSGRKPSDVEQISGFGFFPRRHRITPRTYI